MSENNNSSKINEFDFEDDPIKGKVVDQTMVGRDKIPPKSSLIAIAIVVIVLIGGIRMLVQPKTAKSDVAAMNVKPPSPAQEPAKISPPKAMPAPEPTVPAPAESKPIASPPLADQSAQKEINNAIDKVSKQQSAMVEAFQSKLDEIAQTQKGTLAAIQAQNKQIQTLLDNMNDTQKEMKNRLDAFATHIQVHGQKLMHIDTLMTKQAAEFDVAEDMRNAKPVPKLSVHAAIQGRAWLRDQNNKIFSVVEGDEIAGYGKVLTIDPRLGTVVTNSGQILRY